MTAARAVALGILLAGVTTAHAQMYKCVDERGVTHYSDKPRPGCKGGNVDIQPIAPVSGKVAPRPTEVRLRQEHAVLASGVRLGKISAQGERVYLDDATRDAAGEAGGRIARLSVMRRSWLFVAGADEAAHETAARSGADVIVLELEDFTPADLRPKARALAAQAFGRWHKAGAVAAVRVNPLETCGRDDLRVVMLARPDIVMMSKVVSPDQVRSLAELAPDAELVPNVETAAGLLNTFHIAKASPRVTALLVASEDMVADLGTARSRSGEELAYVRARFLVECRAAGVEAIDCPYTFSDVKGAVADSRYAKRLGYRMKSLVDPSHARAINQVFTPNAAELKRARKIVSAFEKARAAGKDRAKVDGALIEVPIYAAAKRLLAND